MTYIFTEHASSTLYIKNSNIFIFINFYLEEKELFFYATYTLLRNMFTIFCDKFSLVILIIYNS